MRCASGRSFAHREIRTSYALQAATISLSHEGPIPTKPVNVKQVLVYLKHEQHAKLLRHKERRGAPMSEIIRWAIHRYLKAEDSKR